LITIGSQRNLGAQEPEKLWQFYIQLTQVEAAFKDLKDDLSLRPIFHQLERRIEARIFVSFLAYCWRNWAGNCRRNRRRASRRKEN
jgi:transposase